MTRICPISGNSNGEEIEILIRFKLLVFSRFKFKLRFKFKFISNIKTTAFLYVTGQFYIVEDFVSSSCCFFKRTYFVWARKLFLYCS